MKQSENFNALDELAKLEKIGIPPKTARGIIKAIERSRVDLALNADIKKSTNDITTTLKEYVTQAISESNDRFRTELKGEINVLRNLVYWLFTAAGGFILGALALVLNYLPTIHALLVG